MAVKNKQVKKTRKKNDIALHRDKECRLHYNS